jgi:hypothetical protein
MPPAEYLSPANGRDWRSKRTGRGSKEEEEAAEDEQQERKEESRMDVLNDMFVWTFDHLYNVYRWLTYSYVSSLLETYGAYRERDKGRWGGGQGREKDDMHIIN